MNIIEKVGQDVYSITIQNYSNSALLTSGRLILVDTGLEASAQELLQNIQACGYKPEDIEFIILTHMHPDHTAGLASMKRITEATVASHELEAKFISHEAKFPGSPMMQQFEPLQVDELLVDNQIYQGLQIIHTPGHTPGNIAILDQEARLLIAGDSLMIQDNNIQPLPDQFNTDPKKHRTSLTKLLNYQFDKIIAGHGHPIHSQGHHKLLNANQLILTS